MLPVSRRGVCFSCNVESLKREWAIENILFYRTVALFADSFDDPTVTPHDHAHMARAIFEEFIERGASSQVSVCLCWVLGVCLQEMDKTNEPATLIIVACLL